MPIARTCFVFQWEHLTSTGWVQARQIASVSYLSLLHLHWVDTWCANGYVSPSQMAVVDRLDLEISDYIKSKAI